jgi:hypothetical protein
MLLSPTAIRTDRLVYVKGENLLVGEASDLPDPSRVWDDACDIGYTIVSHRTGREVIYAGHQVAERDGDVIYWDYMPAKRADEYQNLPTLRVYND